MATLRSWLTRHKRDVGLAPAVYRRVQGREFRMLTASDVRYIRSVVIRPAVVGVRKVKQAAR
jgi:hypothetical protein